MQKFILFSLFILILSAAVLLTGCPAIDKSNEKNPVKSVMHSYFGAGSYGDIITYQLTHTSPSAGTISYNNETTVKSGTGTFTAMSTAPYNGILEVKLDGDSINTYYCIEIQGKLMITSIPSGNNNNRIVYAVSNEQELTPSECSGDYMWLYYNEGSANNVYDCTTKYGGFTLTNESYNSKYKYYYGMAPENIKPEDLNSDFYSEYFTGTAPWTTDQGGIGQWNIANKRFNYKETEGTSPNNGMDLTGLIYKTDGAKMYVMDQGAGMGFSLGFEYPKAGHLTQSQIAGDYKFVGITFGPNQTTNYGNYHIPAAGDGYADSHVFGSTPSDSNLPLTNITQISSVNNFFKMNIIIGTESCTIYYAVLSAADGIAMCFNVIDSGTNAGKIQSISFGARL